MIQEQEYILETKTTLRINDKILRELKHLAIDDNKTLTEIINEGLAYYLREKRGKKI
jgi:predicted transcriptional regulator